MAKIVISGATGFVGRILVKRLLDQNHHVIVLSRRTDAFKNERSQNLTVDWWDGKSLGLWTSQLDGADAIINLSGEGIAGKRWTAPQKEILKNSRLDATRALISAATYASKKPKTFINASAVGYYGSVKSGEVTEDFPKGDDFLANLCAQWEEEAKKAQSLGARVVLIRIGIVLEKEGGALKKFIPPFRFFVGGPLGSGDQFFPWVHREDLIGIILYALQNSSLSGPVNAVSPGILTMKEFCAELGQAMKRPSWAPVPAFALKILLGEMADMVITGQKAVPKRLQEEGYRFLYPDIKTSLASIL